MSSGHVGNRNDTRTSPSWDVQSTPSARLRTRSASFSWRPRRKKDSTDRSAYRRVRTCLLCMSLPARREFHVRIAFETTHRDRVEVLDDPPRRSTRGRGEGRDSRGSRCVRGDDACTRVVVVSEASIHAWPVSQARTAGALQSPASEAAASPDPSAEPSTEESPPPPSSDTPSRASAMASPGTSS